MGLFDFLKKKEFAKIAQLEQQIAELSKYQGIVDIDEQITKKLLELESVKQEYTNEINQIKDEAETLKADYNEAYSVYTELKHQIDIFTESLDMSEYGVYEPHFDFDMSERYKEEILDIRNKQKTYIKYGMAAEGGGGVILNQSVSQGQEMVKLEKKLMLRAFNGECDSFISTVDWNNIQRMTERIHKSFEFINKVYRDQDIYINPEYKDLKIKELQLSYEYKKKKYDEKEEQRVIREQMREEEKAQREIEAAKIKAEKEETAYQKSLEKARSEVIDAVGEKHDKLIQKIAELESRLSEAEQNKQRALSMAQQTRRGHVYVISNIGSFGENVYKIGMTRRLDPMDRVRELGDASVPFMFDVHALIFSDDAPALEGTLHKTFEHKRVNLINLKREFFNVTLSEIESEVIKNHGQIEFTRIAEAEQYRETVAIRNREQRNEEAASSDFPKQLFS